MADDIIRVSSLPTYPECCRRGAAMLFRPVIEAMGFELRELPNGIGASIGTSLHRAAEVVFREKAASGTTPPLSVATDCAVETLHEEILHNVEFDGPRGTTQNPATAEEQIISMTQAYHRVVVPKISPILVEERLEAEVRPGLILSGKPDIVAREPGTIHDTKSGARTPRSFSPQLGGYSLLVRSKAILEDVTRGTINFVQRVRLGGKTNRAQPDPIEEAVDIAHAEVAATRIIHHIAEDLRVFREGDERLGILPGDPWAFTANPNSILCGERYCPAFGGKGPHAFCHEWRKRSSEE